MGGGWSPLDHFFPFLLSYFATSTPPYPYSGWMRSAVSDSQSPGDDEMDCGLLEWLSNEATKQKLLLGAGVGGCWLESLRHSR